LNSKDIDIKDYYHRALYFDVTEFNTSVKPEVLIHLINRGYSKVLYLDPDIKVYSSLDKIFDRLDSYSIVLTPHITTPILDDKFPNETDMLKTGIYNLGFIGVSKDAVDALNWWSKRLIELGFNDPASGLFTDQKWIDLIPAMYENTFIDRSNNLNVAYWNLHERVISKKEVRI